MHIWIHHSSTINLQATLLPTPPSDRVNPNSTLHSVFHATELTIPSFAIPLTPQSPLSRSRPTPSPPHPLLSFSQNSQPSPHNHLQTYPQAHIASRHTSERPAPAPHCNHAPPMRSFPHEHHHYPNRRILHRIPRPILNTTPLPAHPFHAHIPNPTLLPPQPRPVRLPRTLTPNQARHQPPLHRRKPAR